MADIIPFISYRPAPEVVAEYAALPYDVYSRSEAATEIAAHPMSFLRIDKTAALLPVDISEYDERVYAYARELLNDDVTTGKLVCEADGKPHYYLYRLVQGGHTQIGIVAGASVYDFNNAIIKRHENIRAHKLRDRIDHIEGLGAHTGPILMAYRPHTCIDAAVASILATQDALYDFMAPDGVQHSVWRVDDGQTTATIRQAFSEIDAIYIADGHHRTAAAAAIGTERGGEAAHFLSVLFPSDQLRILDYNRVVLDLNGHSLDAFLTLMGKVFEVSVVAREEAPYRPQKRGEFGMCVHGSWYRLVLPEALRSDDPVLGLDVSYLQDQALAPILGIDDPRSSERIAYVGGARGLVELERRAAASGGVSFSLYPCSLAEFFAVADVGELMPPKSTWFEPKPRSGLFIHMI